MKRPVRLVVFAMMALLTTFSATAQKQERQALKANTGFDTLKSIQMLNQTLNLVNNEYVQKPNMDKLAEAGIVAMLEELDPHSVFIPARNVERVNEGLTGNFEGVGIMFSIYSDTIQVADVVVGGPSEKVGLRVGDKIIAIDGEKATGDTINNTFVFNRLRGKKGTQVKLSIVRQGVANPMTFTIVRDKVPIYSIDSHFMLDSVTGYIRLTRFARTSVSEFEKAVDDLKSQGMRRLVFDLRGNGGGFLDIAYGIADEFLPARRLIVYTEGRNSPRENYKSSFRGVFTTGDLVVLIDEGSASASEIVSGAIQDWDRGTLVGRRSFGKGLVERVFQLKDGSQVRLTTARYYTPSGRSIQKPYDKGIEAYQKELEQRYLHGEYVHVDSIQYPDSLKFRTSQGRIVYGGGGIMPDVFVPVDTMRLSDYYLNLRSKGLINEFSNTWADQHRNDPKLANFESFLKNYDSYHVDSLFAAFVTSKGVKRNQVKGEWMAEWIVNQFKKQVKDTVNGIKAETYADYFARWQNDTTFQNAIKAKAESEDIRNVEINRLSDEYISCMLKSLLARTLYGPQYYYMIMKDQDRELQAALKSFQH